jgi:hypothetical protein
VAQICNLPYRRLAACSVSAAVQRLADCKSAIQQIENLRHASCQSHFHRLWSANLKAHED